ncbi:MAG TPA: class I SAM-dependent methyltransferase [Candidatus Limnocylindrales bacterium]|nr:class I SAM-dependent methyltransferase [Candidatus Limnocylindrales bacterium]
MTYDPVAYWRERGETYEAKFVAEAYRDQEAALLDLVRALPVTGLSVLEVGCGFGRIGALIEGLSPEVEYTGVDLSPAMLESARPRIRGELVESSILDFQAHGRKWDVVLAVEVLMHIPPDELAPTVRKLLRLTGGHLVTVDWTTPLPRKRTAAHNFLHDYSVLADVTVPALGWPTPRTVERIPVGLQTIHHLVRP